MLHLNQLNKLQEAKKLKIVNRHVFTPLSGFPTEGDNIAMQLVQINDTLGSHADEFVLLKQKLRFHFNPSAQA